MTKEEKIRNALKNIYFYAENINLFNLYIEEVSKSKKFSNKMNNFVYSPKEEVLDGVTINFSYKDEKEKFKIFNLHFKDFILEGNVITIAEKLSLAYRKTIDQIIHNIALHFDYDENDKEFDDFFNKYIDNNSKKREELDNLVKIENMYSVYLYDKCIKNKNMKSLFNNLYNIIDGKCFFSDKVDLISDLFVKYYPTTKECQDVLYSYEDEQEGKENIQNQIYAKIEKKIMMKSLGDISKTSDSSRKRM